MKEKFHHQNQDEEDRINDSDDEQQNQNTQSQGITFGSQPVPIKCPFCLQQTRTQIIAKPELVSIVFGLVLFSMVPNAIMIIVVVVALQLTATKKHRCSLCERQLGTDGKFLILFTDEVYSFSLGETGVLISKKIIVTVGLFISIFIIISIKSSISDDMKWSNVTWEGYRTQCPSTMINSNCLSKYQGVTIINWKGFVMRVQDERQTMRRYYDHAVKLYVKMNPAEQSSEHPDLVLTGSSSVVYEFERILDDLRHGDQIVFNATFMKSMKDNQVPQGRHLHLYDLNRTGLHDDNIQIYLKVEEEEWMESRVEGQGLRTEKIQEEIPKSEKQAQEINPKQSQEQQAIKKVIQGQGGQGQVIEGRNEEK